MTPDSPLASDFIPARHYSVTPGREVHFVVLHQTECSPAAGSARNVARWFGGPAAPQASAHYVLDEAECFQLVREEDAAWHAGHTGNRYGIGIEMCGWTKDGADVWDQHPSTADRAARLLADICQRLGLPCVMLDAAALVRGDRGVTTHAEVSKAWAESDHHDPSAYLADQVITRAALLL